MRSFGSNVKNAILYALSDWKVILVIGAMFALTSICQKYVDEITVIKVSNIVMLFVIGYGSFITYYTIKGEDRPPKLNNVKMIMWEGLKKFLIISIYSIFLTFLSYHLIAYFNEGNALLSFIFAFAFLLVWVIMVGGLMNRYLNDGAFLKAFNLVEIVYLLRSFELKDLTWLMIAVMISHVFVISVGIDFQDGFTVFELAYSILTFFLAPLLFIATKRFVAIYISRLVE